MEARRSVLFICTGTCSGFVGGVAGGDVLLFIRSLLSPPSTLISAGYLSHLILAERALPATEVGQSRLSNANEA